MTTRNNTQTALAELQKIISCFASNSHRARRAVSETSSSGTRMDVQIWSKLDDRLLEKIFDRLPVESLFQISSFWGLRLRAPSFQNEVHLSSSASSWSSFAPLFINSRKEAVGYESRCKQWHRLPRHSYLRQDVVHGWEVRAGAGSLLCWVCRNDNDYDIHVTNPLMRSWKQLPPRPDMDCPHFVHVSCEVGAYKVILGKCLITTRNRACIHLQTFSSTDASWNVESYNLVTDSGGEFGGSAFLKGVLYTAVYTTETRFGRFGLILVSFDLKEKIWKEIGELRQLVDEYFVDEDEDPLDEPLYFYDGAICEVHVCGSNVMLVVFHVPEADAQCYRLSVFRLDVERCLAFEVGRAPKKIANSVSSVGVAGQDQYILPSGSAC